MAYATLDDIKDRAPQLRFGQGGLAPDKAQRIIESINAQVDSIVAGLGFTVPVTAPKSVAILKDIVIAGSLAQILKSMFYGVKNPDEVGANDAWREFTSKLKALADPDNPLILEDATPNDSAPKVENELDASFLLNVDEDLDQFRPTRDQVF